MRYENIEFSYIHKLRERTKSGALFFGTAFDQAIEAVLKDRSVDEYEIFDKVFTSQEHNKKMVHIPDSLLVVYSNADLDQELLTPEDWRFLAAKAPELIPDEAGDSGYLLAQCISYKRQKKYRPFTEGENKFLNLASWLSLRRKGHLMLKAHREEVLPMITEVIGAQVKIQLENQEGDSLLGYADLVCKLEGYRDPVIIDYKTTTAAYEADSARTSVQLGIYGHALNINTVGYFVFKKQIIKNRIKICSTCGYDGSKSKAKTCNNEVRGGGEVNPRMVRCSGQWTETFTPKVDIQIIVDQIEQPIQDATLDNIEEVNKAIRAGFFPTNLENCIQPWGRCPYFSLCHEGQDDGSLEDMKE